MPRINVALLLVLLAIAARATPRLKRVAAQDEDDERRQQHDHERSNHGEHFGYEKPDDWSEDYPACAGVRQSPINIELQDVETMDSWRPPLGRFGYDSKPLEMSISNNGHSVQLTGVWPLHDTPSVYGGPLTGLYQLAQVHFHWGAENGVGSEHTVANHSFPLEMHMVHWKKIYQNLTEALNHDDGLVVLGYLMSLDKSANMGIERMRSSFSSILKPGQSARIEPFPLSLFDLDLLKEGYVTYPGSLTTPPCSESVIWLISVRIKDVTIDELESFRKLHLHNDDKHNYRPTQPRNSRSIYYFYDIPI
ncbi:carbonic anhydrase 2-like [Phymastichus coffea]|uniref:carbonic anhydrase 2-like n=1 Tax=Phymastichus coffea TaxID=108790 RepID=UPI00273C111C|nr:carbonic anhydrase 2-like [Phymastichus coffea]